MNDSHKFGGTDLGLDGPMVAVKPFNSLRILYLFAGVQRKTDLQHFVAKHCKEREVELVMVEKDLLRHGQDDDILNDEVWRTIEQDLKEGAYDMLVVTPPCHTHSRVLHANKRGPRPVRSSEYAYGFPWLQGPDQARCTTANILVDRSIKAILAGHDSKARTRFLLEHPEDLGINRNGDTPASIWRLEEVQVVARDTKAISGALFQCAFDDDAPKKPTRFMSSCQGLRKIVYQGPPIFWGNGKYKGPLPKFCGHHHEQLVGVSADTGEFKTKKTASYGPGLCEALAKVIIEEFFPTGLSPMDGGSTTTQALGVIVGDSGDQEAHNKVGEEDGELKGGVPVDTLPDQEATSEEDEEGVRRPRVGEGAIGIGKAIRVETFGKERVFQDGCGLCSPGRWWPEHRGLEQWELFKPLRDRLIKLLEESMDVKRTVCAMACGRMDSSPFSVHLMEEARRLWLSALHELGSDQLQPHIHHPEVYHWDAIGEHLRLAGDPDWRILSRGLHSFKDGVRIGVGVRMPRTPAVFPRKTKWRKYEEEEDGMAPTSKENYKSVKDNLEAVERMFWDDVSLGHMREVPEEEAVKEYGEGLVTAAVGALEKGEDSFRIIHDATHGVKVNPRIKPRDQVRYPGIGEKMRILGRAARLRSTVFGLKADVSKAHRRVWVARQDHGLQACKTSPGRIWLNQVGTFGVGSAGYWWGRLGASAGRLILSFMGRENFFLLLFADDFDNLVSGPHAMQNMLLSFLVLEMMGTPVTWSKVRGGFQYEWIGYWQDLQRFAVGISAARVRWLKDWLRETRRSGCTLLRTFVEGLGRLNFSMGALVHFKPFLAPMYAWSAAVPGGAILRIPVMVKLVMQFLEEAMGEEELVCECMEPSEEQETRYFRADAMAEEGQVSLGGWEAIPGQPLQEARWFYHKFKEEEDPWLFDRGPDQAYRYIASLELIGTLISIDCFTRGEEGRPGKVKLALSGVTDNQGNAALLKKMLTTKFPLCCVLMELSVLLTQRKLGLRVEWWPRDSNAEADRISKGDFTGLDLTKRMPVQMESYRMLYKMLAAGKALYQEVAELRTLRHKEAQDQPESRSTKRRKKSEWQ